MSHMPNEPLIDQQRKESDQRLQEALRAGKFDHGPLITLPEGMMTYIPAPLFWTLVPPAPLFWTLVPPGRLGWYWMQYTESRAEDGTSMRVTLIVEVTRIDKTEGVTVETGSATNLDVIRAVNDDQTLWAGPLEMPK